MSGKKSQRPKPVKVREIRIPAEAEGRKPSLASIKEQIMERLRR